MFQCRHTGSCPRLGTRVHGWVSPLGTWHENPIWGLVSGITTTSFCNFGKFKSISSRNHNLYKNGQLAGWINKSILATNTYFKKHLPNKIWNVNHSHPTDSLSQPQTNTPSPSNAVAKLAMADLPNSLDRATGCDSREVAKIGTLLPAGAEKSATTHLGFQLKFQLRLSKKLHPVVSSSLKFIRDTRPSLSAVWDVPQHEHICLLQTLVSFPLEHPNTLVAGKWVLIHPEKLAAISSGAPVWVANDCQSHLFVVKIVKQ